MHERLVQIIATETGQSVERVRKDTDRNYWMSACEAIDYGVANKIISSIDGSGAIADFPSDDAEAVVLDLAQPQLPGWRDRGIGGKAGRDEARRQGTRTQRHGGSLRFRINFSRQNNRLAEISCDSPEFFAKYMRVELPTDVT
jgi:hypothetical protein